MLVPLKTGFIYVFFSALSMVLWKEQLFLADILQSERDFFFKKWMFLWGKTERLFIDGHARLHLNNFYFFFGWASLSTIFSKCFLSAQGGITVGQREEAVQDEPSFPLRTVFFLHSSTFCYKTGGKKVNFLSPRMTIVMKLIKSATLTSNLIWRGVKSFPPTLLFAQASQ